MLKLRVLWQRILRPEVYFAWNWLIRGGVRSD